MAKISGENRHRQKESKRSPKVKAYANLESKLPIRRIYLFCEGEKTEPLYFKQLSEKLGKNIKVDFDKISGYNTQSLVDHAKDKIPKLKKQANFDAFWVIFDKDDFDGNFNNAIKSADAKNIKYAWSNEAFELWYILHFEFRNSAMSRADYEPCLTNHLQKSCGLSRDKTYRKNDEDIFLILNPENNNTIDKERTLIAIMNAKKLETHDQKKSCTACISYTCSDCNPRTKVHHLVEYIINDN